MLPLGRMLQVQMLLVLLLEQHVQWACWALPRCGAGLSIWPHTIHFAYSRISDRWKSTIQLLPGAFDAAAWAHAACADAVGFAIDAPCAVGVHRKSVCWGTSVSVLSML